MLTNLNIDRIFPVKLLMIGLPDRQALALATLGDKTQMVSCIFVLRHQKNAKASTVVSIE
jgi:hypothetical protein